MKEKEFDLVAINAMNAGTMMEGLGIEYLEAGLGFMKARMPVDHRTCQPMGLLHGGATIALAETLASVGSALMVDLDQFNVVGQHVTANHIRSIRKGWVIAEAKTIHQGKTTHLWNIDVKDEAGHLISSCRITIFIAKKRHQ